MLADQTPKDFRNLEERSDRPPPKKISIYE